MKPSLPILLGMIALLSQPSIALANDIQGQARIVDGDTIWIGETKIRLHGIDTPEMKQECKDANGNPWMAGKDATEYLKSLTDGKEVTCSSHGNDRYGRMIGSCEVGEMDINREMVVAGLARAYRKYSKRYLYEEHRAMKNKAGMWGGECEAPWEWRRK
jgi:endonuclease YncB( thermonuclease family)